MMGSIGARIKRHFPRLGAHAIAARERWRVRLGAYDPPCDVSLHTPFGRLI
jgi:hypothetical protein